MGWLKRAMGLEAPQASGNDLVSDTPKLPLGLALGRMICFNAGTKALLVGSTEVVIPDDDKVMAIGEMDLGKGVRLVRCYLDNEDYFVQFVMGGPGADDIDDIILFGYHDVKTLASKTELLRMIGPSSKIGMPYYVLEGIEYVRQWGTEDGQTEMTALTENVTSSNDGFYPVYHDCVLYARNLELTNRREFLFLSAETDEPGNISLSTAVGVTLQLTDISVL
ncbi:DUF2491 family protein (plasmid) [Pseudomonas amygdali pv. lachrymans]|uniref:DUF2491 family protein n=1 Tax=Pseudomonas amygdali TaxID=47877 RepID=UPI0006B9FECD|nr:DUF2491 family protein [Pseudomonas amygdali]KPC02130.1 Uncharacterized protein AC501_3416 [Pseudomonas amygdali pv. lachrymans]RMM39334.1 hypothetical protein ALQ79_200014 [Pseudomonas amygdali pv. lachrymans]WIO61255.1 DUF2491 family protein [Pseudomonas amygdali pv. lachrymans]